MISLFQKLTLGISCFITLGAGNALAAHPEGTAGLPQFDVGTFPSQLFWLFLSFAILYFVFSKKTLPEISSVLENRREHIASDLETAEKMKKEAEEVHQAYEQALEKARSEAAEYFTQVELETKVNTAKKLQSFYDSSLQDIKDSEQRIEQVKAGAMEDMHSIAAEIASEAAQKIVGISTNIEQAKTVVKALKQGKAKAA